MGVTQRGVVQIFTGVGQRICVRQYRFSIVLGDPKVVAHLKKNGNSTLSHWKNTKLCQPHGVFYSYKVNYAF